MDEIRTAWRRLQATRGLMVLAVFTMALGIGATVSVFSVASSVILRPLPYADPGKLVMIWNHWVGWPATWISDAEFVDYRDKSRSFSDIGAFYDDGRNLTGSGTPERVHIGIASAGVLAALGARPEHGRVFTADEDYPGSPRVAVISHGLWARRFGSDPAIVGREFLLDDSSTTIIGVMPPEFRLPLDFGADPIDVVVPLRLGQVNATIRGGHYLDLVARVRPGVSPAAADSEVRAIAAKMAQEYGYPPEFGAFTRSVSSQILGEIRPAMVLLAWAVLFVLLIACANVANLLLARSYVRRREMALRATLGASRWRIMKQLMVEGLLLSLVGGCVGLAMAFLGNRVLTAMAPSSIPRIRGAGIDAPVALFAVAVSLATGLACSLMPAVYSARVDLHLALKEGGRGATIDRAGDRLRRALVAVEVALSVILLIGAGLLIKSYARLNAVNPGFDPSQILTARVSLPASRYADNGSIRAFYGGTLDRLRALPGVDAAALVRVLPMTDIMGDWSFMVEGQQTAGQQFPTAGDWQVVSADYFRVMRIPLRLGRTFSETDDDRAPGAVIMNEALARRVPIPGPIVGRRIRMGGTSDSGWRTVVGVVADVRHRGLDADARPELYLPEAQWPAGNGTAPRSLYVVLRARRDPRAIEGEVRGAISSIDPSIPLSRVRTMEGVMGEWTAERRLTLTVLVTLAMAAGALAAVGLFGVVAFMVSQRTSEIGIRRALGANAASVIGLVTRQGAVSVAAGMVAGVAGAFVLSRLAASMLFEVSATDAATFCLVPLLLAVVAALAAYLPARRATKVDPITALRAE